MKTIRLAFLLPALIAAAPAAASPQLPQPHATHVARAGHAAPIRYVTLDRMIREFAGRAQATRELGKKPTIIAQR